MAHAWDTQINHTPKWFVCRKYCCAVLHGPPWASLSVCMHTHFLPVHPLWLAAIFAKLPSVLSPALLPLLTHVSRCCHPSLSWAGSSSPTWSCFAFHPTPPSSSWWALLWELFAFSFGRTDFQFIIAYFLEFITMCHGFFFPPQKFPLLQPLSYRHLQALYWFVLPALPAQSPCCQVSGSVYFLQLFSPHRKVKAGIPGRPLLSGKNGLPLRPEV